MNILYRNIPEALYNAICDKQCELMKLKKREVSRSEAITALIKQSLPPKKEDELLKTQTHVL